MKRFYYCLLVTIATIYTLTSCESSVEQFDDTQLFSNGGKWETASLSVDATAGDKLFYIYYSDGTGVTWDEGDDITESEASKFTWEVDSSDMIHIYPMENGGADVPQHYTLITLTTTLLKYKGTDGKSYSFTKV